MNLLKYSISLLLIACSQLSSAEQAKILIFGDFGTGKADQSLVAIDMINFCQEMGCDYGITTGDNIYPLGIENLKNGKADYDNGTPNFANATNIFTKNYSALKIPLYMTYGNHDIGNDGFFSIFKDMFRSDSSINKRTIALMNNQINYTVHPDNPVLTDSMGRTSRLWNFYDDYYNIEEKGNVNLFSINTNTYPHRALDKNNKKMHATQKNYDQENWLDKNLKTVKNGWKIVFGHMPLYTHGSHGWLESSSVKDFRESIVDTLCDNKVDFYVSGHDHHLEIDTHTCSNGHIIVAVLSGAAAKRDRVYKRAFPLFGSDKNLVWANGRYYKGDDSIFRSDDDVLGFSYLNILDASKATLIMKQTVGNSDTRKNGCFSITKGKGLNATQCP